MLIQDAKSDRVKQLLKETEKYLQKLGSKLQEAKSVARSSEHDADEMETASFLENSETAAENDDENDQAKVSNFFQLSTFSPKKKNKFRVCLLLLITCISFWLIFSMNMCCSIIKKAMKNTI